MISINHWSSPIKTCILPGKELIETGLDIATNTVAFATKFFPFATKISGEVANLRQVLACFHLRSFETKGLAVAPLLLLLL